MPPLKTQVFILQTAEVGLESGPEPERGFMSYSDEWTEWHLTPRGWERGSERTDGPDVEFKEPPADRVLYLPLERSSDFALRQNASKLRRKVEMRRPRTYQAAEKRSSEKRRNIFEKYCATEKWRDRADSNRQPRV